MSSDALSNLLQENRVFPPAAEFAAQANAQPAMYAQASADRLAFWAEQARALDWFTPFDEVLDVAEAEAELRSTADRWLTLQAPAPMASRLPRRERR